MNRLLAQKVRTVLLQERLRGVNAVGLSWLTSRVTDFEKLYHHNYKGPSKRSRFTSGAPKTMRGAVAHVMVQMAQERIVFTRQRPEPAVPRYEHGETDKRWMLRITPEQAAKQLKQMEK